MVGKRYYFGMSAGLKTSARAITELVVQLGRIAHGDGYTGGLTPAQWSALRYLSRANRFSRTVSAFAEFHATTRARRRRRSRVWLPEVISAEHGRGARDAARFWR